MTPVIPNASGQLKDVIELDREEYSRLAIEVKRIALDFISQFDALWTQKKDQALESDDGAKKLHESRAQVVERFQSRTEWVKKLKYFDEKHRTKLGEPLVDAKSFLVWDQQHDEFQRDVLDRWQTLDDLEEILLDPYRIPIDTLRDIAVKSRPPQSWFDDKSLNDIETIHRGE